MVSLTPTARAKHLRKELPGLLQRLEDARISQVALSGQRREVDPFVVEAQHLGIVHASQGGTDFPGSIYVTIEEPRERTGGIVDPSGSAIPSWAAEFLVESQQADVLAKLARSGLEERHVFILLPGFTTAPFGVVDMLRREDDSVPEAPPVLPPEVTHVWLVSLWSIGRGLRWSPEGGWARFNRT